MKKIIATSLIILVCLGFIAYLLLIPKSTSIVEYKSLKTPSGAIGRLYQSYDTLHRWWPGVMINDTTFLFQDTKYTILNSNQFGISLDAELDGLKLSGSINTIKFGAGGSILKWQYQNVELGNNPFKRIKNYFTFRSIRSQVDSILTSLKNYSEDYRNIYGFEVMPEKVKDSSLITTSKLYDIPPTNEDVMNLVNALSNYIQLTGGIQDDYPMLRVDTAAGNKFQVMVAIPLKKDIPAASNYIIRKMVLGNLLTAKIIGGPVKITKSQDLLEEYIKDHNITPAALPFQSLVTNRQTETDSSKWVTILKYPVM